MANPKLYSHLRRVHPARFYSYASQCSPTLFLHHEGHILPSSHNHPFSRPKHCFGSNVSSLGALSGFASRSFWTRPEDVSEFERTGYSGVESSNPLNTELRIESGIEELGLGDIVDEVISSTGVEESILPIQQLITMLDELHQHTGMPWWAVIASSTIALRFTLLPLLIIQLNKLRRIGELFPKLPPPLPPPLSGRSYIDQFSLFRKERKAIGCPSFLWFPAYFSIQIPCFLLWMITIRKMSLDHHPGFDCGGALWFQNLTEYSHGVLGPVFPFLISSSHFLNVQISFRKSSMEKATGIFGLLAKYYKLYLNLLTVPLFFIGYCIPQGSLVYWVTNSSFTVIQQLSLQHPAVRSKLGLPLKDAAAGNATFKETSTPGKAPLDTSTKWKRISLEKLSPKELLALSVQLLSKGQKERAIPLLRQALNKEPEYVRALIVLGQTLLQNGQPADATEYLERAISKLFLAGHPIEVEDVDHLILASQWAGVASIRQGKMLEGIAHLERVANLKEPEDSKSKAHYYDGLVLLSSALYNEGRKAEATKYLQLAAAYDPAYKEYLEQCEDDNDKLVSDLVSSRRRDY